MGDSKILTILNQLIHMAKKKDKKIPAATKPVEIKPEVKKVVLSEAEERELEKKLNSCELEIIKNIQNPEILKKLEQQKAEVLTKLGRTADAPWKKQSI